MELSKLTKEEVSVLSKDRLIVTYKRNNITYVLDLTDFDHFKADLEKCRGKDITSKYRCNPVHRWLNPLKNKNIKIVGILVKKKFCCF